GYVDHAPARGARTRIPWVPCPAAHRPARRLGQGAGTLRTLGPRRPVRTPFGCSYSSGGMAPSATDRVEPWVWRIAVIVILGAIMSILDTTIVNVALSRLSSELHSSIANIQWVVTGYLLSLAAVIPISGWAGRRFGAKQVYLMSLVLFTLGSVLCGVASSATMLIAFRVVQGVGGGLILPVGQMMMAAAAGPRRMGRVMSVVAVPAVLAPILGPALGGLILDNASWR